MPRHARIPITNVYCDGDYTGRICVGPKRTTLNVILDTGSSALAINAHKYSPEFRTGDAATKLAQTGRYADKSGWAGALITTWVAMGEGETQIALHDATAAIAYEQIGSMFGKADGILGLAYAALDEAYRMPALSWPRQYSRRQIESGKREHVVPYLTQLEKHDVTSDKAAFYTQRSSVHMGHGGVDDPLNKGWLIVGGGEESTDLYKGRFQTAKVLSDDWYSTNLKAIVIGDHTLRVPVRAAKGSSSNSIVDSGTTSLCLGRSLLTAITELLSLDQQEQLKASLAGKRIAASALDLAQWPNITFVLQGEKTDVSLPVAPRDYWQVNAPRTGDAVTAFGEGEEGGAILGLPLMNGYFTIFDGEADHGRGAIKFALARRPS